MPVISRFFGIIILMYFEDHAPPHFHARYAEFEITVNINTGVITGNFPSRALKFVIAWHEIHKIELLDNWTNIETVKPLNKIDPLE